MNEKVAGWENEVDFEVPDELVSFQGYPFIQWVNQGGLMSPPRTKGGFATPVEQRIPVSWEYADLGHPDGKVTPVLFSHALVFLPVATRFAWVVDGALLRAYVEGARGKLQALGWVLAEEGPYGPVTLTVKGMAGRSLSKALRKHSQRVALEAGGSRRPQPWFFWAHLKTGEPQLVGKAKKSVYTPIEYDEGRPLAFAGKDVVMTIVSMADEIAQWKRAWREPRPNGDGEVAESEEE